MSQLELVGISKHYGGLAALSDINISVKKGELVCIIGPNGAGKTTLFKVLTGLVHQSAGSILFDGKSIGQLTTSKRVASGIAIAFQAPAYFKEESILWHVKTACYLNFRGGIMGSFLGLKISRESEAQHMEKANKILRAVGLTEVGDVDAKNLSQGHLRELGIAMALATEPRLLLLDEPGGGLNAQEKSRIVRLIRGIRDRGTTILFVEHDMAMVMGSCERIVVLNYGKTIADGIPAEILNNKCVIDAYLGDKDSVARIERP